MGILYLIAVAVVLLLPVVWAFLCCPFLLHWHVPGPALFLSADMAFVYL